MRLLLGTVSKTGHVLDGWWLGTGYVDAWFTGQAPRQETPPEYRLIAAAIRGRQPSSAVQAEAAIQNPAIHENYASSKKPWRGVHATVDILAGGSDQGAERRCRPSNRAEVRGRAPESAADVSQLPSATLIVSFSGLISVNGLPDVWRRRAVTTPPGRFVENETFRRIELSAPGRLGEHALPRSPRPAPTETRLEQ